MRYIKIILTITLGLIVIFLISNIGSYKIYNKPIEGRAVDKDTGYPIEGACVVVALQRMGMEGGHTGLVNIKETQTDKNGSFKITEWGPTHIFNYFFIQQYPSIAIFKPGYKVWRMGDLGSTDFGWGTGERFKRRKEVYKTKIFKMEKFKGSLEEWNKELSALSRGILLYEVEKRKLGSKIEKTLKFLKIECEKLIKNSRNKIVPICYSRIKTLFPKWKY